MAHTDKVRQLISEGKTQSALDWLQKFLKGKSNDLLNRTLLLEAQFRDASQKAQLNLDDTTSLVNRINLALLHLCDEADSLDDDASDATRADNNDAATPGAPNPLVIFGVISVVAVAIIAAFIYFLKNDAVGNAAQKTALGTFPPANVQPSTWQATPSVVKVLNRYYGNFQVDVLSAQTTEKDANNFVLTLRLRFFCQQAFSGVCIVNYLKYRLISTHDFIAEPNPEVVFDENVPYMGKMESDIQFIVPKTLQNGILEIFYLDKRAESLTTLNLKALR